jgi:hypothetical protein
LDYRGLGVRRISRLVDKYRGAVLVTLLTNPTLTSGGLLDRHQPGEENRRVLVGSIGRFSNGIRRSDALM